MKATRENGWTAHEEEQRLAWLRLTPAQRLTWLEEAKRFADLARRARKTNIASRPPKTR
jgi:hypothetical protein